MRRHRIKLAFVLVVLAALGTLAWSPVRQGWAVEALERAQDSGVSFRCSGAPSPFRKWVDSAIRGILRKFAAGRSFLASGDYDEFRRRHFDPIDFIVITLPFEGDSGAVLSSFPDLRAVAIQESRVGASEEEWRRFCAGLGSCRRLEEVHLVGPALTDDAFAALSGHPSIRVIAIGPGQLTPGCVRTLATFPQLTDLYISDQGRNNMPTLSAKDFSAMSAALPKVGVHY